MRLPATQLRLALRLLFWLAALSLYVAAARLVELDPARLAGALANLSAIFVRMLPLELDYTQRALPAMLETLEIALLATFIAGFLSLPFGLISAWNLTRQGSLVGKTTLSIIRVVPELLFAVLFIRAVGPGAAAGVLALSVNSVGMLGKFLAELVEGADPGPLEALRATGARPWQVFQYALLPQVLPEYLSQVLFRFEINVRAAAILGVVGAGGIGTPLIISLNAQNWPRVGMLLLILVVATGAIDALSSALRKRLL